MLGKPPGPATVVAEAGSDDGEILVTPNRSNPFRSDAIAALMDNWVAVPLIGTTGEPPRRLSP